MASKRTRKYSKAASDKVGKALHEEKRGRLRSGSGQKVTSREQAIAIALSQARREGKKVPDAPGRKKRRGTKKRATKKRGTKKRATKKSATKESATKKSATKKRPAARTRATKKRAGTRRGGKKRAA